MNIKYKRVLIIIFIAIISIIAMPNKTNAGLQANKGGTSLDTTTVSAFFTGMRRMETQYGTLGKNAVLNEKFLDTTENGIDSHMILNTEWGTVALLTDSIFGVGTGISGSNNDATSTGNASGVYNLANEKFEYTATTCDETSNNYNKIMVEADARYFNHYSYTNKIQELPGDAVDCRQWLSGANSNYYVTTSSPTQIRSNGKTLFGLSNSTGFAAGGCGTRAVVVCGEGL